MTDRNGYINEDGIALNDMRPGDPVYVVPGKLIPEQPIPTRLVRFLRRVMALQPGQAYALTLWIPEAPDSEPVWSVSNLGKIENQR